MKKLLLTTLLIFAGLIFGVIYAIEYVKASYADAVAGV